MSFVYTPDPTNNPTAITMPSDGDPKVAASVVVPLQACADLAARCRAYLIGDLSGPILQNALLQGVTRIDTGGRFLGDGSALLIGEPGETCTFLGPVAFNVGQTVALHGTTSVDGVFNIANGGFQHVQSGGNFVFDGGSGVNMSGTMSVFGLIHVTASGGIIVESGGNISISASGTGTVSGAVTVAAGGSIVNGGVIRNTGAGHRNDRSLFGDLSGPLSIAMADHFGLQPTAPRAVTMLNTGCIGGETITLFNEFAGSHAVQVFGNDGTTLLITLNNTPFTGVELINDGANTALSWHFRQTSRA